MGCLLLHCKKKTWTIVVCVQENLACDINLNDNNLTELTIKYFKFNNEARVLRFNEQ